MIKEQDIWTNLVFFYLRQNFKGQRYQRQPRRNFDPRYSHQIFLDHATHTN